MTLSRRFCSYLLENDEELRRLHFYLALSHVPDEKVLPTALINSPLRATWIRVMDRYIQWRKNANHPRTLRNPEHWKAVRSERFIIGRKVSFSKSKYFLARLMVHLQNVTENEDRSVAEALAFAEKGKYTFDYKEF